MMIPMEHQEAHLKAEVVETSLKVVAAEVVAVKVILVVAEAAVPMPLTNSMLLLCLGTSRISESSLMMAFPDMDGQIQRLA